MVVSPLRRLGIIRRRTVYWTVAFGALALVAAVVYDTLDGTFWPITWPIRYAALSERYRHIAADRPTNVTLMDVFPIVVPTTARNVRFNYWTPPGDVSLQLRYTLPAADVAAVVARWSPVAVATARGGEQASGHYNGPIDDNQYFVGDQPGGFKLPESYVVYTTADAHTPIDGTTQYSYTAGVAVDEQKNDVIYWLQGSAEAVPAAGATRR